MLGIFIDLSKASETVNQQIILKTQAPKGLLSVSYYVFYALMT